jgi:hypothetical protein
LLAKRRHFVIHCSLLKGYWYCPPVSVQLSQQDALEKVSGLECTVAQLRHEVEQLHEQLQERKDEIVTQRAVNQQLMLKKEEVEWQLMAAMAKVGAVAAAMLWLFGWCI